MLNGGLLLGNAVGSGVVSVVIGPVGARETMLVAGAGPLLAATGIAAVVLARRRRAPLPLAAA
jgi:hypothetical protein